MPPKNDFNKLHELIEKLSEKIDGLTDQISNQSVMMEEQEKTIKSLTETVETQGAMIRELKEKDRLNKNSLNDREQYARNYSARIFGLKLPSEKPTVGEVLESVYDKLLHPILQLAYDDGKITEIPPVRTLIEYGHTLPSRKGGPPPIIVRFYSRELRSVVFRYKRKFLNLRKGLPDPEAESTQPTPPTQSRHAPSSNTRTPTPPTPAVYISEDLTVANHKNLMEFVNDDAVFKAWSINGKIKYILVWDKDKESDKIKTVKTIFWISQFL